MSPDQRQQIEEINTHLGRALRGFISEPDSSQTRTAIYSALSTVLEVACRRLVDQHIEIEVVDDAVIVYLDEPLCDAMRGIYGADVFEEVFPDCAIKLPGWSRPESAEQTPAIDAARTYVDPRTNRPTRGRPGV